MARGIHFFVLLVLVQATFNTQFFAFASRRRPCRANRSYGRPSDYGCLTGHGGFVGYGRRGSFTGYGCHSNNICPTREAVDISYKLSYVANQPVEIYVNAVKLSESPDSGHRVDANIQAPCQDIVVKLKNTVNFEPVAISAIVEYEGKTYGTRQIIKVEDGEDGWNFIKVEDPVLRELIPLYATSMLNADPDFANPNYDFSDWVGARIVDSVLDEPVIDFLRIETDGAVPLGYMDGPQPIGTFGVKIMLPFCYDVPVTNYM